MGKSTKNQRVTVNFLNKKHNRSADPWSPTGKIVRRRCAWWLEKTWSLIEFQWVSVSEGLEHIPVSPDFFLGHRRVLSQSRLWPFRTKPPRGFAKFRSEILEGNELDTSNSDTITRIYQNLRRYLMELWRGGWERLGKLETATLFFFVELFFMTGCQKHAPNKLANSHLNGFNMTGWCGWFSSFKSFPKATRNEYLQYRTGDGYILYQGVSTCVYNLGNGIHWLSSHTFTVSGSMSIVPTISAGLPGFRQFFFFPLQQFPSFPKTSQNKKHTIKTPSKFPIPPKIPKQQKQPQKKSTSAIFVAQLVQNRMNFLDDASQFWPRVAQTLEGVEGDSAWIAGKTMGTSSIDGGFTYGFNRNIIYRWRFYLWF